MLNSDTNVRMIDPSIADIDTEFAPTIRPDAPVSDAAEALRCPDAPAVVVLDEETPVGIVTGSDIVAMVAETEHQPAVRSVMSAPVATVSPEETIVEAAERMNSRGVRHLPVVDGGTYCGIVSPRTLGPYLSRYRFDIEWSDEPLTVVADAGGSLPVEN